MRRSAGVLVLTLCWTNATAAPPGAAVDETIELEIVDDGAGGTMRRGTFRVWEDRGAKAGRILELDVVVLPATGPDPAPDPIAVLGGGPGQNAASLVSQYVEWWPREHRDIVLMSQRGTGGNNRLACDLGGSDDNLQAYLDPIFDVEVFRDCLADLSARFDLTQYSTCSAMDDLNDLRQVLGYDIINLVGGSYGTRASFIYMRRHPQTVRTATLTGIAPVSFTNPLYHAQAAQDAVDAICAECAADPTCAEAYPQLDQMLRVVLARLDAEPARVDIEHPLTGEPQSVSLDRVAFAEALRVLMYYDSRRIPWLISRAFEGDYLSFAEAGIGSNRAIRDMLPFGMLLCVTCAEDVDRIDPDLIAPLCDDTFLGDGRVRQQSAVCAFWPRSHDVPDDYGDPVAVDVPVLLLSGDLDPVSAARFGTEAARHLPNGLHLIFPGSHGLSGTCVDSIRREFLASGTIEGLDVSCVAEQRHGAFQVPGE